MSDRETHKVLFHLLDNSKYTMNVSFMQYGEIMNKMASQFGSVELLEPSGSKIIFPLSAIKFVRLSELDDAFEFDIPDEAV